MGLFMNRYKSREQAFIFVFESTFGQNSINEIIEFAQTARDEQISDFARELFEGVIQNQQIIDEHIEKNIKGWKKDRLARTTVSILRIAVYEMLFIENIPVSVSINEAVELAKKYSTQEDASYINGVLGTISKDIENRSKKIIYEDIKNILSDNKLLEILAESTYKPTKNKLLLRAQKYMENENVVAYGAKIDDKFFGVIVINCEDSENITILDIAVSKNSQNKGVGKGLINFVIDKLLPKTITAETDDDAVNFYKKLGFNVDTLPEKVCSIVRYKCILNTSVAK